MGSPEQPAFDCYFFFYLLEISETTIYRRCRGERFRASTRHTRRCYVERNVSVRLCFVVSPCAVFSSTRLLLSGNPLDCVCENIWIKLRLLEETDSPDLTCIDDRGAPKAFASLSPPDCGNVKPCYNKPRRVSDIERSQRRSLHGDGKDGNKSANKSIGAKVWSDVR